jgi:hypothetical protein
MQATDESFTFGKDVDPGLGMTNFWPPEDGFIWSTGHWCQINFDRPDSAKNGTALDIALDIDVFKAPPTLESQNIFFYVNGLRLASRAINRRLTIMLELPASFVRPRDNIITIDTPEAGIPSDFGGNDPRRLGIQLFSLRITGE